MGIVSSMEDDTGDGLLSEVLSIPMIIRGEPTTTLASGDSTTKLASPRPTTEALGLPLLSKSDKGRAGLFHGTILGRLGIPELLR